jgi:hypothetical protein
MVPAALPRVAPSGSPRNRRSASVRACITTWAGTPSCFRIHHQAIVRGLNPRSQDKPEVLSWMNDCLMVRHSVRPSRCLP